MTMRAGLIVAAILLLFLPSAAVFGQSLRSEIGVEANTAPWSGIAMVTNSVYGRCTGILVNSQTVLTAAHCLYSPRTKQYVRPQSVHVLFGYDRGTYSFHTVAEHVEIAAGYDPEQPRSTLSSDWAVLTLKENAPPLHQPFAVAAASRMGQAVFAAGFAQERSEVLTRTPDCVVEGRAEGGVIVSDCGVSHGLSGGPLIDAATHAALALQVGTVVKDGQTLTLSIGLDAVTYSPVNR
ncbi:trypsin-like serine protease [Aurantimonas sp. DM33-3]|nr:trypsin-like serine protease [Aurantimonas sp. DM33-3]